jgi:hypothetical protein
MRRWLMHAAEWVLFSLKRTEVRLYSGRWWIGLNQESFGEREITRLAGESAD